MPNENGFTCTCCYKFHSQGVPRDVTSIEHPHEAHRCVDRSLAPCRPSALEASLCSPPHGNAGRHPKGPEQPWQGSNTTPIWEPQQLPVPDRASWQSRMCPQPVRACVSPHTCQCTTCSNCFAPTVHGSAHLQLILSVPLMQMQPAHHHSRHSGMCSVPGSLWHGDKFDASPSDSVQNQWYVVTKLM